MKRLLALFLLLDLVFIGLVIATLPDKVINRNVASEVDQDIPDGFSEGQKNKWSLVKSFQFKVTNDSLEIKSELLQSLCDVSTLIEFVYLAENIAYAGIQPSLHHIVSCHDIKKDLSTNTIITSFNYFVKAHKEPVFTPLAGQQIRAFKIYDDEPLPTQWLLSEIKVTGQNNFIINSAEIEKALALKIEFKFTSVK